MNVTLEQARALDALARHGTFAAAAQALHKGHTAVLYALRTLAPGRGGWHALPRLGGVPRRG